ncbi:MAG TPA: hypothetical protein VF625_15630 [Longimicrobium sp.]
MPSTFSEYVVRNALLDDEPSFLAAAFDWMNEVEEQFLVDAQGYPRRELLLEIFRRDVGIQIDFNMRHRRVDGAPLVTTSTFKTRLDRIVNQRLNVQEPAILDSVVLPPPKLAHSHLYTTPGVACTAGLIDSTGALSGAWGGITTYSGNHGSAVGYLAGGGGAKLTVAVPIPVANWNIIKVAKPGLAEIKCLGEKRHAEDGWFAYHYTNFVNAAKGLAGLLALPKLSTTSFLAQTRSTPRIEFLMSMPPCLPDDGEQNAGCANYFAALRTAVGDRIPIVLYCYRPFEAQQGKMRVYTIDAAGQRVSHPNTWLQG